MFRDASQPVRSNKPTPTVCVIRRLIVIPPTIPEFKLHPAIRSQSSNAPLSQVPGNLMLHGEVRHSGERSGKLGSQPMATGCSPLSAFVSTSEPVGKHAVGVSKSCELSRVSAPTQTYPNRACPTALSLTSNCCPESLSGREDSCFLHHRLSGYAHAVGKGRVGWACGTPDRGQLGAPEWVWERYGEPVPLLRITNRRRGLGSNWVGSGEENLD
jgi:hypothetical protein